MINVWDIPTRLFHWTLVILFIFLIISGENDDLMEWHFYAGYALSGMICFRLIWGFLGTRYARFSTFTLNPLTALEYSKALLKTQITPHYGHTPAGSIMVVVLIALLSLQILTGLVSTDDVIWNGPFYNYVNEGVAEVAEEVHETIQGFLQLLVGLHILAIIIYKVKFKEALVPAMIHGKKPKHANIQSNQEDNDDANREGVSIIKFLLSALPALALTYWLFSLPI